MSAPDLLPPEPPTEWVLRGQAEAWRAGWLAGYDAALAAAEAILQRESDAEDAERAKGSPA